jgi:hypothetical protein
MVRRTRKRGGAETVFICQARRTANRECIQDFSNQYLFDFIDVAPDGDCFFHTLELYYRRKGNQGADKTYSALRAQIITYILNNWDDFSGFGLTNDGIIELMADGAWNNQAGDLVIPAAAGALNIQIQLYDIRAAIPGRRGPPVVAAVPKQIIHHIYPDPELFGIPPESVNILRINDGHFGLLVPRAAAAAVPVAPVAPLVRKRPVVAQAVVPNIVANTANKLKEMKINAAPTNRVTRSKPKVGNAFLLKGTRKNNVNASVNTNMEKALANSKKLANEEAKKAAKKEKAIAAQIRLMKKFENEMEKKRKNKK